MSLQTKILSHTCYSQLSVPLFRASLNTAMDPRVKLLRRPQITLLTRSFSASHKFRICRVLAWRPRIARFPRFSDTTSPRGRAINPRISLAERALGNTGVIYATKTFFTVMGEDSECSHGFIPLCSRRRRRRRRRCRR